MPYSFSCSIEKMRNSTGIVIPVYFPDAIDTKEGEKLLRDNVYAYCEQIEYPENICLSVDGNNTGEIAAEKLSAEFGVSRYSSPVNKGKLNAVANAAKYLLENNNVEYIAVVDQDGDHFANELLNFIRTAEHIKLSIGDERVIVLGKRISKHKPMGFLRGELEELADRVLLDALHYNAAIKGVPLRLEYANVQEDYPDFHSGYKLFSARTAKDVFTSTPKLAGVTETCYYRHACEAVMALESLESGAYLGVVNRSTFFEQPISTFGLYKRCNLVADKIIWPCRRLGIPPDFIAQWVDNNMSRLLLFTLAPDGLDELHKIRELIFKEFGIKNDRPLIKPVFV